MTDFQSEQLDYDRSGDRTCDLKHRSTLTIPLCHRQRDWIVGIKVLLWLLLRKTKIRQLRVLSCFIFVLIHVFSFVYNCDYIFHSQGYGSLWGEATQSFNTISSITHTTWFIFQGLCFVLFCFNRTKLLIVTNVNLPRNRIIKLIKFL